MAFCKYCGKELVNGVCDCEKFVASRGAAKQEEAAVSAEAPQTNEADNKLQDQQYQNAQAGMQQSAPNQQYQNAQAGIQQGVPNQQYQNTQAGMQQGAQYQQYQNVQPNPQIQTAQNYFGAVLKLVTDFCTKPISTITSVISGENVAEAYGVGAWNLLVLFITLMIHLPFGEVSGEIEVGYRARLGFVAVVGCVILIAIGAGIHVLVQKIRNQQMQYGYLRVVAALCLVTIPTTLCFVVGFIFGFFAIGVAMCVYVLGLACYIRLSLYVYHVGIFGDADKKAVCAVIISLLTMIITSAICYYILGSMIRTILTDYMSDIAGGGLLNNLFYGGSRGMFD